MAAALDDLRDVEQLQKRRHGDERALPTLLKLQRPTLHFCVDARAADPARSDGISDRTEQSLAKRDAGFVRLVVWLHPHGHTRGAQFWQGANTYLHVQEKGILHKKKGYFPQIRMISAKRRALLARLDTEARSSGTNGVCYVTLCQMTVVTGNHPRVGVTECGSHHYKRGAAHDRMAGETVPQDVKANCGRNSRPAACCSHWRNLVRCTPRLAVGSA